jgi:hypothetical protein
VCFKVGREGISGSKVKLLKNSRPGQKFYAETLQKYTVPSTNLGASTTAQKLLLEIMEWLDASNLCVLVRIYPALQIYWAIFALKIIFYSVPLIRNQILNL